jgi:hypothetical protein
MELTKNKVVVVYEVNGKEVAQTFSKIVLGVISQDNLDSIENAMKKLAGNEHVVKKVRLISENESMNPDYKA